MKTTDLLTLSEKSGTPVATTSSEAVALTSGFQVRTGLSAGWQCTACEGQAMGSQLFKPSCSYCQQ